MASFVKSALQSLRKYIKKPWEITGPCADPEYRSAIPMAMEYRPFSPATPPAKVCIPTSEPETVFDIKYYTRDRRRNRPPVRRTVLRKADVERIMAAKTFGSDDFPKVYLTKTIEEDQNTHGGFKSLGSVFVVSISFAGLNYGKVLSHYVFFLHRTDIGILSTEASSDKII
ncbi:hypothetical protein ZIOFF_035035 [Zingiber officinale]|uniref:Uncharacterized protein n=1 Tax=Zingiber officinale TaxID=94328 RepID=A0A8J5KX99_ZINOF|nr:hypothetical protein ZIOFF_035035 [Zingiber officinale]